MFCWPCIIVYQYSETNVMHFLFSLLRMKCLYLFRALLAHPQEALNKRHLVYCVCVMSVGCTRIDNKLNKRCITLVSLYWWLVHHICWFCGWQKMAWGSLSTVVNGILSDASSVFVLERKATFEVQELNWISINWNWSNRWSNMEGGGSKLQLLRVFKLLPCSECCMLSSGWFTSVCSLNANVSEHYVCSVFIGE
jgi:hypothetical protein